MFQTKCYEYIAQRWVQRKDNGASRLTRRLPPSTILLPSKKNENSYRWESNLQNLAVSCHPLKKLDSFALKTTAL
ncbi:hypothetical protein Y032_0042g508 [Ancylostoma ceylanicum]|uniref:Uncharacterized protein n=1 Tax=Ancylostoma ceylanicum TaxID=53326 RepID=A0A016UF22_9BILA|nr:hypothetical protein Y032_0042g508 [Ancylostoma ceylanicum]